MGVQLLSPIPYPSQSPCHSQQLWAVDEQSWSGFHAWTFPSESVGWIDLSSCQHSMLLHPKLQFYLLLKELWQDIKAVSVRLRRCPSCSRPMSLNYLATKLLTWCTSRTNYFKFDSSSAFHIFSSENSSKGSMFILMVSRKRKGTWGMTEIFLRRVWRPNCRASRWSIW